MENISLFVKKELAEDIEELGGRKRFFKKNRKQLLSSLVFDKKPHLYGKRADPKREVLRNLVKCWNQFTEFEYQTKVLDKL